MTEELKPCPFCGGAGKLDYRRSDEVFRVHCTGCFVGTRPVASTERAAQCWNQRPSANLIGLPVIDPSMLEGE